MYEVYSDKVDGRWLCIYQTTLVPNEEYIWLITPGTSWKYSLVTFKPANIDDAPLMVIDTYRKNVTIGLPRSVDEWEIKYYSNSKPLSRPDPDYLKNAGVVNLNEKFRYHVKDGLHLELSWGQFISRRSFSIPRYSIPAVDCSIVNELPGVSDIIDIIGDLK